MLGIESHEFWAGDENNHRNTITESNNMLSSIYLTYIGDNNMIGSSLSASGLARAIKCPASCALPAVKNESMAATRGIAIHQFLEDSLSMSKDEALAKLDDADWRDTCSRIDTSKVFGTAVKIEPEVAFAFSIEKGTARILKNFRQQRPETAEDEIIGIADLVLTFPDGSMAVFDYKTGYDPILDADENAQLKFLALCIYKLHNLPAVEAGLANIQPDGYITWAKSVYTNDILDNFYATLSKTWFQVKAARGVVAMGIRPNVYQGDHCKYCPAMHSCPAYTSLAKSMVTDIQIEDAINVNLLSLEEAGQAWEKLKRVQRVLDAVESALKARVTRDGGLPLSDGKFVRVVEMNKEVISVNRAIDILKSRLGVVVTDSIIDKSITKAAIEKAVGKKGAEDILNELRQKGAISQVKTVSIREQKPVKQKK